MIDTAVQNDFASFNPFMNQLDGGLKGDFYQKIQEFFSYAQIYTAE